MTVAQFWSTAVQEIRITPGGGKNKPKKGKGGKGNRGGGWTGRGGGWNKGGGSYLPPVMEVINVSSFSGSQYAVITDIAGVDLGEFSFISIRHNAVNHINPGSGLAYGMQLSADGGSTWLGSNKDIWVSGTTGFNGTVTVPEINESVGPWYVSQWIQDFNSETPTVVQSSEMEIGMSSPRRHSFMTAIAQKHNAIRFEVKSSGGVHFSSGTIELVGYRTRKAAVQSRDFSASSGSEWFVSIPAGHTIANIYAVNVGRTVAERIDVQASVAGTPVAGASDYHRFKINHLDTSTFDFSRFDITATQTSNGYGHVSIWNLNTPAPLHFTGEWLSVNPSFPDEIRFNSGTLKKDVAYDEIRISVASGVMNAGTIYVETYNPETSILEQKDFGAAAANLVDISGLTVRNASALIWASIDNTFATADFLRAAVMIDGTPDLDSNDYVSARHSTVGDNILNSASGLRLGSLLTGEPRGSALIVNLPLAVRTHMVHEADWAGGDPGMDSGVRDAAAAENGIRFYSFNSNNFNAGTLFLVGYGL